MGTGFPRFEVYLEGKVEGERYLIMSSSQKTEKSVEPNPTESKSVEAKTSAPKKKTTASEKKPVEAITDTKIEKAAKTSKATKTIVVKTEVGLFRQGSECVSIVYPLRRRSRATVHYNKKKENFIE